MDGNCLFYFFLFSSKTPHQSQHRKMYFMKEEKTFSIPHLSIFFATNLSHSPSLYFYAASKCVRVFPREIYTRRKERKNLGIFLYISRGKSFHLGNAGYIILNLFHAELIDVCFLNLFLLYSAYITLRTYSFTIISFLCERISHFSKWYMYVTNCFFLLL